MSPKQGPVWIGNASEPTMDFQGFRGSKQVKHSKLGNIPVGPTKDTSTYLLEMVENSNGYVKITKE